MSINKNKNEQKSPNNLMKSNRERINASDGDIIKGRVAARITRINQLVDKRLNFKPGITQIDKKSQLDDINVSKGRITERIAELNRSTDEHILQGRVSARIAAINERLDAGKKINSKEERKKE